MKNNNQRSPKGQRHMINESVKQKDWQELKAQQNLKDKKINYQSYSDDEDSSSLKSGGGKQSGDELEVGDDSQDYQSDMRPSMNQRDVSRLTNQRNFEARSQASNLMSNQLKNQQNLNNNQQLKPSPIPSPNNNQNPTSAYNNKAVSIAEQKEKLLKNIQKQTPQDSVKLLRKRNSHLQSIGYNGYLNIITKKDKSSMTVSEEIFDVLKSIEEFEPFYRDYVVVTVLQTYILNWIHMIYLAQPLNKKMLSEELQEAQLGGNQQQQDITNSVRKKFFEWTDGIATAKIFANDSREQDTIIIELLSTKLTKSCIIFRIKTLQSQSYKLNYNSKQNKGLRIKEKTLRILCSNQYILIDNALNNSQKKQHHHPEMGIVCQIFHKWKIQFACRVINLFNLLHKKQINHQNYGHSLNHNYLLFKLKELSKS